MSEELLRVQQLLQDHEEKSAMKDRQLRNLQNTLNLVQSEILYSEEKRAKEVQALRAENAQVKVSTACNSHILRSGALMVTLRIDTTPSGICSSHVA